MREEFRMPDELAAGAGIYDDFPGYRLPSDEELDTVLQSALVVVDANVLLNLYRYNATTRDDLLGVLRQLGDRLWVPHQALREFWRNRLGVLESCRASTDQALTALSKQLAAVTEAIKRWAKSVAVEAEHESLLVGKVAALHDDLEERILALAPSVPDADDGMGSEPILMELEALLDGKAGRKPTEDKWQAAVKEGNERAARQKPPGYRDADKAGSALPEGAAGDYLIWLQATEEASQRGLDLLLVTGDEKDDWWWRHRSDLLGPHVELVVEFQASSGRHLYMMRPTALLKRSSVLDVTVRQESVEDAERVSRETEGEWNTAPKNNWWQYKCPIDGEFFQTGNMPIRFIFCRNPEHGVRVSMDLIHDPGSG
jgi:PIN like domain